MSVSASMRFGFPTNKDAQRFSTFLHFNGYDDKMLFLNTIEVNVWSHGDRVVVMEAARRRGAKILAHEVCDDY